MNIVTIDGPNGRPIMGSYVVKDGWLTVRSTKLGTKRAQLHASSAEALARLLLGELAGPTNVKVPKPLPASPR